MTDMTKISIIVLGLIAIVGFFAFQAVGFYSTEDTEDNQIEIEIDAIEIDLDVIKNLDIIQTDLGDALINLDDTLIDLDDIMVNLEDILIHLDTLVDLEHVDDLDDKAN